MVYGTEVLDPRNRCDECVIKCEKKKTMRNGNVNEFNEGLENDWKGNVEVYIYEVLYTHTQRERERVIG
jgi:hypothetical protein